MTVNTGSSRMLHDLDTGSERSVAPAGCNDASLPDEDYWTFDRRQCSLVNNDVTVILTRTECVIFNLLASSAERVVSKEEILLGMKKNLDQYYGMEMCLSRLQAKFRGYADGVPLFRSVRNRGYCLVQKVRISG